MTIFARRKKNEIFFQIPPCISERHLLDYAALTAQEGETDIAPSIAGKQAHMERAVN